MYRPTSDFCERDEGMRVHFILDSKSTTDTTQYLTTTTV